MIPTVWDGYAEGEVGKEFISQLRAMDFHLPPPFAFLFSLCSSPCTCDTLCGQSASSLIVGTCGGDLCRVLIFRNRIASSPVHLASSGSRRLATLSIESRIDLLYLLKSSSQYRSSVCQPNPGTERNARGSVLIERLPKSSLLLGRFLTETDISVHASVDDDFRGCHSTPTEENILSSLGPMPPHWLG